MTDTTANRSPRRAALLGVAAGAAFVGLLVFAWPIRGQNPPVPLRPPGFVPPQPPPAGQAPDPVPPPPNADCLDARAFGARGDRATDDTDALQRAIDSAQRGPTPLFIPAGGYIISRALRVTDHCTVYGVGPVTVNGGTQIICTRPDQHAFEILTNDAVHLRDMNITVAGGVRKTAGAAVFAASDRRANRQSQAIGSTFRNLLINAHWYGFHLDGVIRTRIQDCHVGNPEHSGVVIDNSAHPDGGLVVIDGLMYFGRFVPQSDRESVAGVWYRRGGGFRITNSALVGGKYGVLLEQTQGPTGSTFIQGNWIEEQSAYGICLQQGAPRVEYSNVVITGNEFTRTDPIVGGGAQGAVRVSEGGGWIQNVLINNNSFNWAVPAGASGTGVVNVFDGRNVQVCNNVFDLHGIANGVAVLVRQPATRVLLQANSVTNAARKYVVVGPGAAAVRDPE